MKPPKRPRDPNQLAKMIVDLSTGQSQDEPSTEVPETALTPPIKRGRPGGLIGGRARADALSSESKSAIARSAANARWHKVDPNQDR